MVELMNNMKRTLDVRKPAWQSEPWNSGAGAVAVADPATATIEPAGLDLPVETKPGNYFVSNYPPYSQWSPEQVPGFERALRQANPAASPLGLYVHVPFCRQRCMYCYFRVHIRRPVEEIEAYIDAVLREAALYRDLPAVTGRPIANAYFGGGTPTHLSTAQIERLMGGLRDRFDWSEADEVTCECQPGTFEPDKLIALRRMGVTRASIGVQTFTDAVLRGVGRVAGEADCLRAYQMAREVGFEQVNIDLMSGLPGETDETWRRTIDRTLELGPDCVTIYQFELTHNSALYKSMQSGNDRTLANWPTKRRWVREAFERMQDAGYTIYGAYWAVRDPKRNRFAYVTEHYWRGDDLLGLGETSFGFLAGHHYQNADTFDDFIRASATGRLSVRRAYRVSAEERLRRQLILQLKTGHVDLDSLRERFGVDVATLFAGELECLSDHAMLHFDRHEIVLTREGLLCVDWLLPRFYLPQHQGVRYT
jgi:oxygen-independent coproporphyrinogen III oxidase